MIYKNIPKKFNSKFEVVSCWVECDGKILLLYRQKHKSEGSCWGVPAGKIELKETKEKAMIREIHEETGLKVAKKQLKYLTKVYVKYPDYHFIYHMFHMNFGKFPKIKINFEEHKKHKWILPKKALSIKLIVDLDRCIKMFYDVKNRI